VLSAAALVVLIPLALWLLREGRNRRAAGPEHRADGVAATAGAPGHAGLAQPVATRTPEELLQALRAEPPERDLVDLAVRLGQARPPVRRTRVGPPPADQLGDRDTFWVHDIQNEQYFTVTARLEVLTGNAVVWVQEGQPFDRASLEQGAHDFADTVMPRLRELFGTEWSPGVDGDPRVHLLHHQDLPGIAGYFSSADEHTAAVDPRSNEHEMFYINLGAHTPGSPTYLALLAHEYQHMIHWHHDVDEPVWANEGLSELAPVVAGYPVQTGRALLDQPDTGLMEWEPATGANAAHYAAAFLYFAFLRARYGDELIRTTVARPENGPNGVEAALAQLGRPATFHETFLDWVVANVLGEASRGRSAYNYGELTVGTARPEPLGDAPPSATVNQYGTDYLDVTARVAEGRLALDFDGSDAVGLLEPVPSTPGSVWWSGRGDNSDSRLTRAFDLRELRDPRLAFRAWFDLEPSWDYAYFQVSTDGGETWTRLATDRTTDADPNGNNYGSGLTGASGGWIDEALDLGPYAGREVLVRFEVITDDAVNFTGMALDDLRLVGTGPAGSTITAGAVDDAESDGGWIAEGWQRLDPALPQRWGLQVIVDGPSGVTVHRVPTDARGDAEIRLDSLPSDATVILAVSGLTPGTRHPAGYWLSSPAALLTHRGALDTMAGDPFGP
jgi:hypothetical protein